MYALVNWRLSLKICYDLRVHCYFSSSPLQIHSPPVWKLISFQSPIASVGNRYTLIRSYDHTNANHILNNKLFISSFPRVCRLLFGRCVITYILLLYTLTVNNNYTWTIIYTGCHLSWILISILSWKAQIKSVLTYSTFIKEGNQIQMKLYNPALIEILKSLRIPQKTRTTHTISHFRCWSEIVSYKCHHIAHI